MTGGGVGLSLIHRRQLQQQAIHRFARLLEYLADLLEVQALTGEELLRRAARYPEFAASCPPRGRALSALYLPPGLPPPLQHELQESLHIAESSSRRTACTLLNRMAALCYAQSQQLTVQITAGRRLWPSLGICLGALTAIVLW